MADTEVAQAQSADIGGGETLGDFLSDAFGEVSTTDLETPEDAGAAQATASTDGTQPEGTSGAGERPATQAGDATTPAPDTSTTPVVPTPAAVPEPDPLDGASPFTYTVNGQARSIDGIQVLGEHGGIISKEALPFLQQRFSERDTLFERAKESYEREQQFEQLAGWASKNSDGTETAYKGLDGIVEMRVQVARLEKENDAFAQLFKEPAKLAALLLQDEAGKISTDPERLQLLALRTAREQDDVEKQVRGVIGQLRTARPQETAPQQPNLTQYAAQTIEQLAGAQFSKLTPQDKAILEELYPRFLRPVTPQDRLTNPSLTVGARIVDYGLKKAVDERIALRTEIASTAQATVTAAQENARRLAAAAVGQRPTVNAPAIPQTVKKDATPAQQSAKDQDTLWNMMEDLRAGKAFAKMNQ